MAGTTEAAAPLENFEQLVAHFQQGPKPKTEWKIGTEHEKFVFNRNGNTPVPYDGPNGIRALLEGLQRFGWTGIYEGEYIIGLKQDDGATISLEPGGQFELSGAQVEHIHQTCTEVGTHLRQVREVADELGLAFLGLGFQPKWSFDDVPIMPKGRYTIMRNYMPKVGGLGRQMMFRSCTVQTNLDFSSEADMVKKLRVSLALQPIATALFANSPFFEGRPNGFKSYRANVWGDTDSDRTGMLPFMFKEGAGFADYANWALDVPMYFAKRNGVYVNLAGRSFRDFMAGKLPELPGDRPTAKDWEDHLSTLFPEVRLKTYLEMRGADAGPWSALCALPAFWVGLLYDETALDAAWDMVKDWSAEEREGLRRSVPAMALQAPFRRTNVQALAREALAIARQGLKARARLNSSGDDETGFLSELDEIAATGVTPAERLLERYRTEWNRDVEQAFIACAY